MRTPNYVVPDHGIGAVHSIPTIDVDTALVTRLLDNAGADTADVQVTLLQRGEDLGFYVEHNGSILSTFPEEEALEYPELAHIAAANLTPEVTARAERFDEGGIALSLRLPLPGLCIPANEPPLEPWALLDGNGPRTVLYYQDAAERDVDDSMSLLVCIEFDKAGDVVASLGNGAVGRLDSRTVSEITPTLRNLERRGLAMVVRGYHAPAAGGAELTVNLNGVQELGAPQALSPVPYLPLAEAERLPELVSVGASTAASVGGAEHHEAQAPEVPAAPPVTAPDAQFKTDQDAAQAALAAESTPEPPSQAEQDEAERRAQLKHALHPICLTAGAILILLIIAGVIAISSQWVGDNSAYESPVAEAQAEVPAKSSPAE
ncbi:hypothetical protein [uncultured Corynebacterium sp.]|uniref:hypothetical protein n=1 Tax=uncultured Corynebacterium sp. TaxID=159447 RepID=UPI002604F2B1|nr:hypothetical protein [uncultured Corynebacterium sp.]